MLYQIKGEANSIVSTYGLSHHVILGNKQMCSKGTLTLKVGANIVGSIAQPPRDFREQAQ